jgi:enoyl-CoA hydratase
VEIIVEQSEARGVVVLTLNAPSRRNALTLEMAQEMVDTMSDLEKDDSVRAVVITGAAPDFCAGADLSVLRSADENDLRTIYDAFLSVARSSLPTVAAINGAAVGAGVNLALSCDLRLACPETKVDVRFLRLGVHPGGGSTWMLSKVLGVQGTAALLLFGEVLTGSQCQTVGFAWDTIESGDLLRHATSVASRAAAVSPELLRRTKSTLRKVDEITHAEAIEVELSHQLWSLNQPSFRVRIPVNSDNCSGVFGHPAMRSEVA